MSFTFEQEFEKLFMGVKDIEHRAAMISYRVMSEVEKSMDKQKMTKKELAQRCGTSASYITQLFRGTKQVNTAIMAKFEFVLRIQFKINAIISV